VFGDGTEVLAVTFELPAVPQWLHLAVMSGATHLLEAAKAGDGKVAANYFPLVYDELV
jgi:hypothetical protein